MYRRVAVPMLLILGVWVLTGTLSGAASYLAERAEHQTMIRFGTPWSLPVLPDFSWLLLVVVLLALRLCAARGGSRQECLRVGLLPLVLLAGAPLGLAVYHAGPRALPIGLGFGWHYVLNAELTLGTVVAVREALGHALSSLAVGLAATWLYLYVSRPQRLPEPSPNRVAA